MKQLDPTLREALAKHAGKPWRGTKGDTMVSVKFDALVAEGIDWETIREDVLEVGGSVSERDTALTGGGGIRRSKPLVPESFVVPAAALQAG